MAFEIFELKQHRLRMKLNGEKRIMLALKHWYMLQAILVVVCAKHPDVSIQTISSKIAQRHASMMKIGGDLLSS